MSCNEAIASRDSSVMAASSRSVAGLTVQRTPIAPVAELGGGPFRIGRVGQLGEDAAEIGLGFFALARNRPGFGEAGEIFAAVVLPEPGESGLPQRERGLVVGGGARGELARPRRIGLVARPGQQ